MSAPVSHECTRTFRDTPQNTARSECPSAPPKGGVHCGALKLSACLDPRQSECPGDQGHVELRDPGRKDAETRTQLTRRTALNLGGE